MVILPENRSATALAIDAACHSLAALKNADSPTLRASSFDNECDRFLWMTLHWAYDKEVVPPRIKRIMDNYKDRKFSIISVMRQSGMIVRETHGNSWKPLFFTIADGAVNSNCDGIVSGVPEAEKTEHVLKFCAMNKKRWQEWRRKGVKVSDHSYWVQMQISMRGLGLTRALLVCECQDTKEIETERVHYDDLAAARIEARAGRIFASPVAPERIGKPGAWPCNLCPAHDACHGDVMPRRNCRTCLAVDPLAHGHDWHCKRHHKAATETCDLHLFNPSLINGEQMDANQNANTVTYQMSDGSTWVDGMIEKKGD